MKQEPPPLRLVEPAERESSANITAQFGAAVSYLDAFPLRVLSTRRERRAFLARLRDHVTTRIDCLEAP
jgi:hypothetical protein